MNSIRLFTYLVLGLIVSVVARAAGLPRVAIVPDSPEPSVAAFADFLSVSLASASTQYALVERAEITRLASEAEIQKLAADERPVALAKLAKADGLIIVGADKGDPARPKLTLRLTSTNNGLVLRSLILGGKESEFAQAADLAAGVLRFPCARLTHGDAKPPIIVSLLGLRPAFDSDGALETTLNLAIAQQLSAQSGMAVSERWRMNHLLFERSLTDEVSQEFATGTVLLDGSYFRNGDALEVSLRLRNAESEAGKAHTLRGPANKPADLARQIAELVATESGQSGKAVAWSAIEEGKQYAALGWWLLKRNLPEESIAACETAVALALDGRIVAGSQMLAYQEILYGSMGGVPICRTRVDGWDKLPKLEFKQKLMHSIRMSQLNIEVIGTKWGGGGPAQQELSDRYSRRMVLLRSVAMNMKVLQALCLRGEQLELAAEARTLRALSRELVKKGEAEVYSGFSFEVVQLGYMFDTPEEAAADLRSRLQPELISLYDFRKGSLLRDELWGTFSDPQLWRLVDWSSTDNSRGREVWRELIEDLQGSDCIIERSDGLALAYQSCNDLGERVDILSSYCSLLENNFNELLTPRGQMIFTSFLSYYKSGIYLRYGHEQHPAFELRMAKIFTRILESGKILEPATICMLSGSIQNWGEEQAKGNTMIPESMAVYILHLIEQYIEKNRPDPKAKIVFEYHSNLLKNIPRLLIQAYPRIKEQRIVPRPAEVGAVPIRGWKPELPGAGSRIQMDSNHMISCGDSLLIPSSEHGIIDLDVRTLSISRVMDLPFPKPRFIGGLTKNDTSLMINVEQRLFMAPLASDGKFWKELLIPDVKAEDRLTWHIQGIRSGFFVGSGMLDSIPGTSQMMLAGMAREGKLTWNASSKRRPVVNPIDGMDPHVVRCAYRNPRGNTMVLLEREYTSSSLVELETGREVFSTMSGGTVLSKGDVPLCVFYDREIQFLAALDPAREEPRFLFKGRFGDQYLPEKWKNTRPAYDSLRPEFLGQWISMIFHDGHLWLLKRESEGSNQFEKNDPQGFRLVRMDLDGGEPIVIPLRYDLPEDIRKLGEEPKASLDQPIINYESLTATSKGLFFAASGFDYRFNYAGSSEWGRCSRDPDVPVLLYITWEDINAWLVKNGK